MNWPGNLVRRIDPDSQTDDHQGPFLPQIGISRAKCLFPTLIRFGEGLVTACAFVRCHANQYDGPSFREGSSIDLSCSDQYLDKSILHGQAFAVAEPDEFLLTDCVNQRVALRWHLCIATVAQRPCEHGFDLAFCADREDHWRIVTSNQRATGRYLGISQQRHRDFGHIGITCHCRARRNREKHAENQRNPWTHRLCPHPDRDVS